MDLNPIKQIKNYFEDLFKSWENNYWEQYSDEAFASFLQLIKANSVKLPLQERSSDGVNTEDLTIIMNNTGNRSKGMQAKYCPKCKTNYDQRNKFCGKCGFPLMAVNE